MSDTDEDDSADEPFADLLDEIEGKKREKKGDTSADVPDGDAREDVTDRDSSEEPTLDPEDVFVEESFEDVDSDELWNELESGAEQTAVESEGSDAGTTPETDDLTDTEIPPDTDVPEDADTHVVPKRSFCQSCRYLTDPPQFRCTAEGSEIVAFVDVQNVRVRNCPIVEERRSESERGS